MSEIAIKDADLSMEELIKDSAEFTIPNPGEMIEGRVIDRGKNYIIVDIEGVSTGIISGREMTDSFETAKNVQIGDLVSAFVLDNESEDGMVVLSLRKASHLKVWDKLEKAHKNNEPIDVVAKEANKGGLMSEIDGMRVFLPVSQLAPTNFPRVDGANAEMILEKLQKLVSKKFTCKIIMMDESIPKVVVSERAAYADIRAKEMTKIKAGDIIEGEVNGIVKFGIFITFGNLEGLVHVSEITWDDEAKNPQKNYKMGQKIKAKVIGFENEKISLSVKRLEKDPWMDKVKEFDLGSMKKGTVNKVTNFGIFVTLAEDITGLVHVSEFTDENQSPEEMFKVGDEVEVKILEINEGDHSLRLSLKTKAEAKKEEKTEE